MKYTILLFSLLLSGFVFSQEPEMPSVEELHARKWGYLVEKAKLSPAETARIKPIFMEFEKAVWRNAELNKEFFREFYKNKNNRSESDYQKMNDMLINSEIQKAHLVKVYYSKLKKQLSAETIYKYFNAERSFRRELIDNWPKHRGPKK
jgi:hypothetical protein